MPVVLALLLAASPSAVLQSLNAAVRLHGVALSRDGARVAWVEQVPTPDGPAPEQSVIQVLERKDGAHPKHVTAVKSGDARDEGEVAFSPDGRRLAVLFIEGGADERGPLLPASRETGVIEERVKEQRLSLVPADGSGAMRAVSPADLFVYEYDWSTSTTGTRTARASRPQRRTVRARTTGGSRSSIRWTWAGRRAWCTSPRCRSASLSSVPMARASRSSRG